MIYAYMRLADMVGKRVLKAYINAERTAIRLQCEDGWFDLWTDADCCSESWVEHVDGVAALTAGPIEAIEEIDIGEGVATRQEYDQIYAVKIKIDTERWEKVFSIEFRNSSNGYYGGSMCARASKDDLEGFTELTEAF